MTTNKQTKFLISGNKRIQDLFLQNYTWSLEKNSSISGIPVLFFFFFLCFFSRWDQWEHTRAGLAATTTTTTSSSSQTPAKHQKLLKPWTPPLAQLRSVRCCKSPVQSSPVQPSPVQFGFFVFYIHIHIHIHLGNKRSLVPWHMSVHWIN